MDILQQTVNDAIKGLTDTGMLKDIITGEVEKAVSRAVCEVFRPYSPLSKQIEAAASAALAFDVERLGLPSYNEMVLTIIRTRMAAAIEKIGTAQLDEQMAELLASEAPETLKLSELVHQFKEWAHEDKGTSGVTIIVEEPSTYGSRWIYFDPKARKEKYTCGIRLLVRDDGKLGGAW